jgi:hypothetical protein
MYTVQYCVLVFTISLVAGSAVLPLGGREGKNSFCHHLPVFSLLVLISALTGDLFV